MILIFPPVAKPCEPPAGVALLSSALKEQDLDCHVIDANAEGLHYLIQSVTEPVDSWSARALKNKDKIISDLKDPQVYTNMDRYHQRVYDLNKLLSISVDQKRFKLTLSDYSDHQLSSVSSTDLLKSAAQYQDNPFYSYFEDALKHRINSIDTEFIGLSICYLNQALTGFALAGWIKTRFPEKRIVLGGGLISSWMSRPDYDNPFDDLIDVMIRGEGENQLVALLGQHPPEKRHFIPDYDFVDDALYLSPGRVLPFRASIGCYWSKCRFCPEKAESRAYSSQRASKVLDDVRYMADKYHPDYIHFIDNAMTPAFLKALSGNRSSFQWYGFVRFEKEFLDERFCENLKQSGCAMLKLGLESGDQNVLDQMNKGTDLKDVSVMLKNLKKAGILTFVYLLFGTRFEDKAAAHRTLSYIETHIDYIDYLNLAVFNLPKFSEDAQGLETKEFYHGDLSLYLNFTHPEGWDRKQVKRFLDKEFKRAISYQNGDAEMPVVRKNPAFFSSNHAAFFTDLRS